MAITPAGGRVPRVVPGTLVALVVVAAALAWLHRSDLPLYGAHVTGGLPAVALGPAQLARSMDEAALRQHFGSLAWQCANDPALPAARTCVAGVSAVDEVAALMLTARLQAGALQSVALRLPWWAHHSMLRKQVQSLGAPATIDSTEASPGTRRRIGWQVQGGTVLLDRDPGWDPLKAVSLTWLPPPGAAVEPGGAEPAR